VDLDFRNILDRGQFIEFPFPHWIVKDVFTKKTLYEIELAFPNSREIYSKLLLMNPKINPYDQNTSYPLQFKDTREADNILGSVARAWEDQKESILDYISEYLPIKNQYELSQIKSSSIARGDFRTTSPVTIPGTTQLGPHLDSPSEIFAGLIYLRQDHDLSSGGNLELYKLNLTSPPKYSSRKRKVPKKYLTKIEDIPYEKNIGIFFISHPEAIHGISSRSVTEFDRRLINLTIEVPVSSNFKMFDINSIVDDNLTKSDNESKLKIILNKILSIFIYRNFRKNKYEIKGYIKEDEL